MNKFQNCAIHNFAHNLKPGGPTSIYDDDGHLLYQKNNSNTQEDQIINYYKNKLLLPKKFYPIIDDTRENNEALLYSKCGDKCPIITLPSLIKPNFNKKHIRTTIIKRIELLYVSSIYNHALITGLWGCGAFGANPEIMAGLWGCGALGANPEIMAELWKEAIFKSKYRPKNIIFAIYIDEYTPLRGLMPPAQSYALPPSGITNSKNADYYTARVPDKATGAKLRFAAVLPYKKLFQFTI